MATYSEIMVSINQFLTTINKCPALSPEIFRGVFIKKLSNSNLISSKKYVNAATGRKTHQSHLDLTGQDTLKFFFGDNPATDKEYTQIMIDIPVDNLKLAEQIDIPVDYIAPRGLNNEDCYVKKRNIPDGFLFSHTSDLYYYSYAFKKLEGHSGDQNQINRLKNRDEFFQLCSCAYESDLLVFMQHALNHYVCMLIPAEYSSSLSSQMETSINYSVLNPTFNAATASKEFCDIMSHNMEKEFSEIEDTILSNTGFNGQEKEQLTKVRVGQGSFRKLLIEQRGCTCQLCDVNLPEVLRASHIQSWSSSSAEERMDLQNGLLLCANHDALFDRHMISFDVETNELLISESIPSDQIEELKLNHPKAITLGDRMKIYMKKHFELFEK